MNPESKCIYNGVGLLKGGPLEDTFCDMEEFFENLRIFFNKEFNCTKRFVLDQEFFTIYSQTFEELESETDPAKHQLCFGAFVSYVTKGKFEGNWQLFHELGKDLVGVDLLQKYFDIEEDIWESKNKTSGSELPKTPDEDCETLIESDEETIEEGNVKEITLQQLIEDQQNSKSIPTNLEQQSETCHAVKKKTFVQSINLSKGEDEVREKLKEQSFPMCANDLRLPERIKPIKEMIGDSNNIFEKQTEAQMKQEERLHEKNAAELLAKFSQKTAKTRDQISTEITTKPCIKKTDGNDKILMTKTVGKSETPVINNATVVAFDQKCNQLKDKLSDIEIHNVLEKKLKGGNAHLFGMLQKTLSRFEKKEYKEES